MQKKAAWKSFEIKGVGPEVAGWSDNGKIFIKVNFGANSQLKEATQIHLNCCY